MTKKYESESRRKQVETTIEKHGENFYSRIGHKGGKNNSTKFKSDSGRKAALKRWEKYRDEQGK